MSSIFLVRKKQSIVDEAAKKNFLKHLISLFISSAYQKIEEKKTQAKKKTASISL